MGAWYVVQVKRGQERRVAQRLAIGAIPSFLPLIEVVRQYEARRVRLLDALFPGYLFAQMEALETAPRAWDAVRWAPGVQRILGTEGPMPLADEVVDAIQERVGTLGFVRPGVPYRAGERVRMRRGALAGLEGVFDRPMAHEGRVRVLLDLLGEPRGVHVDVLELEPA